MWVLFAARADILSVACFETPKIGRREKGFLASPCLRLHRVCRRAAEVVQPLQEVWHRSGHFGRAFF